MSFYMTTPRRGMFIHYRDNAVMKKGSYESSENYETIVPSGHPSKHWSRVAFWTSLIEKRQCFHSDGAALHTCFYYHQFKFSSSQMRKPEKLLHICLLFCRSLRSHPLWGFWYSSSLRSWATNLRTFYKWRVVNCATLIYADDTAFAFSKQHSGSRFRKFPFAILLNRLSRQPFESMSHVAPKYFKAPRPHTNLRGCNSFKCIVPSYLLKRQ